MTKILNAKGRPFSWSFSRLNDFENCPKKYAEASFYCTAPYVQTPEGAWGDRVHKAAEMFMKGIPHKDEEALLPVEPYCTQIIRSGCHTEAELEIALTRDLKLTNWFSGAAWLRIKIDLIVEISKIVSSVVDWKTGRTIKHDQDQLRLAAAVLNILRPHIKQYKGAYIWTQHKKVVPIDPIDASECPAIWEGFIARVYRMEEAWRLERFPARPSGLCPWCPSPNCASRRGERRM